jgi:uncharacterized SAM-binding protein YcdF (DUF218 family)
MISGQRGGIISRLLALLMLCGFAGMIYLARHPLLRAAAGFCIVQDRIEPADVIIVIGDDDFAANRATEAAALFRAGWAPQVVASGRMLRPYLSLADIMARDLESGGIPASAIVRFSHRADNTLEEAEGLRVLIAQKGWRRILLVTSNYHTRRARYIFRKVLPGIVSLEVAGASGSGFEPATWWESRQGRKTFFLEIVGYLVAVWELRHQLSSSATPIGQLLGLNFWALLTGKSPKGANNQPLFSLHR